jgi:hypothetical protein
MNTPRTDAIVFLAQPGMMPPYNTVPASFARELETELEVAKARIAELEAEKIDSLRAIK